MGEDVLKEKKSVVKKCAIRLSISVIAYAFGIFMLTMDADIGVKIFLSILFCGLPSAIGRSDRKMEKLLKKNEGKTVVVVKKKKSGIIMTILKGIFNLVIGYIATPYLCFQYVMTIVRTQKEIKSLQGGGVQGVASATSVDASATPEAGAATDAGFVEKASATAAEADPSVAPAAVSQPAQSGQQGNAVGQTVTAPIYNTVNTSTGLKPLNPSWFAVFLATVGVLVLAIKGVAAFYACTIAAPENYDLGMRAIYYAFSLFILSTVCYSVVTALRSYVKEVKYKKINGALSGVMIACIYLIYTSFMEVTVVRGAESVSGVSVIGFILDALLSPLIALIYCIFVKVTVLRESRYERKEAIPEDKKKKIAVAGIVAIALIITFCFPVASKIATLFNKGIDGADKIDLGMTRSQVTEILGEPYEKSGDVLIYYDSSYAKKLDKIDNADLDDIEDLEDLDDALSEEDEVKNARHCKLVIRFMSDKVWNVSYRIYENDKPVGEREGETTLKFDTNTYHEFDNGGLYAKYEVTYTEGWEKGYVEVSYDDISLKDLTTTTPRFEIEWYAEKEEKKEEGSLYILISELNSQYGADKIVLSYYNNQFSQAELYSASESEIKAYDALLQKYDLYRQWLADFEK